MNRQPAQTAGRVIAAIGIVIAAVSGFNLKSAYDHYTFKRQIVYEYKQACEDAARVGTASTKLLAAMDTDSGKLERSAQRDRKNESDLAQARADVDRLESKFSNAKILLWGGFIIGAIMLLSGLLLIAFGKSKKETKQYA